MDTPKLILVEQHAGIRPIGAVAPGNLYPTDGNSYFNVSGWSTLCIDAVLNTAVPGNIIDVQWHNGLVITNDERYPIPVTGTLGQNVAQAGGTTFHQLRLPIKSRQVRFVVTNPAGAGAQDFADLRIWATGVEETMEAEFLAASRDVVIGAGANANLVSGLQTGVAIRTTGTINIGRTIATAVWPINALEAFFYEMKGNIIAVNPGAVAVTVHVIETRI